MSSYTDQDRVIIIGGGPVGLVAAMRLGLAEVPVLLFEAEPVAPIDLRASTFHPPTLDMLDEMGLGDDLIAQGLVTQRWQIRMHQTHEKAEFDLSVLKADTNHPYRLQCEQTKLCALIRKRLVDFPHVKMIVGARVETIAQDDTSVSVNAVQNGEKIIAKGQFLIGADGAHSITRNALGFEFPGMTYPETTILATTTVDFFDLLPGLSNVNYVWAPQGTFSLLRLPDLWRCSLYPYADETIEDALKPEAIEAKLQAIAPRNEPYPIGDVRPYRVHQRIVERYQSGRIFLAGDSAHVNSPSGGMGMNGGIHDAYVLTALMVEAWASKDLSQLSSYTDRRRPIALSEILAQADRNRSRMQERDPERRRAMLQDLQRVTADPIAARAYLLKSSMIEGLRKAGL